ncbi:hypothetical protein [Bradyrhizobium sp. RT4b]|uniref:hypothetical protein n=1 Tax=Bradyrhizobium sp. RT4b TaxID=3156379 RepID=UPI003391DD62
MAMPAIRHRHRRRVRIEARTMMSCDEVIYLRGIGMHEVRIVRVSGQQGRPSASEGGKDGQSAIIEIAGRASTPYQFTKWKADSCVGGAYEQIALLGEYSRQSRRARPQPLIGNNPATFKQMREVEGTVKMIPIPMRENDRRRLASIDVEIGGECMAIEGDRKSDIEVQNGAAAIIA